MQQVGAKGFADAQLVDPRQLPVPVPLVGLPRRARLSFGRAWILHRKLMLRAAAAGIVAVTAVGLYEGRDQVAVGAMAVYSMAQGEFARAGFGISSINITGQTLTSEATILKALDIGADASILTYDADAALARIKTIPSIKTRRAETTLEIPSGGAMAMAGLIQDQTKQAINGMPGLMQLPVLGSLFRSRDYVNNQTELMVLVTPYIVRAVAQKDLSRPDDGFTATSDPQADLMGSINRIYGVPGRTEPARSYRGQYGFITD